MRLFAVLIMWLSFAAPALAQVTFTDEVDWRAAHREAQARLNNGRITKWSGLGLIGGGIPLIAWGVASKVRTGVNVSSTASGVSINVKESPRWPVIGVGAGMAGIGIAAAMIGSTKQTVVHRRLDELEIYGRGKGWSISLIPTGARLAFRW